MSKAKKRIFNRSKDLLTINCSRNDAVKYVTSCIKSKHFDKDAKNMISLFGITGEELAEAGLNWEELKAVSSYL